ncbi:MAG TPA: histidine kinase [Verrucomicrobiota bacterium]|nr:histidine kinase [Verrucomicrobiota bacterium]
MAGNLVAAVGLVAGGIRLRERRKLRRALLALERQEAVEQERRRIAQDMHDELGSRLAKVSLLCELAKTTADRPAEIASRVSTIAEASRAVLATLDEMVWAVNPQNDTLEHLAAYIGEYAQEFFQTTRIECEVRMPVSFPDRPLPAEVRHHLFLAVQESFSNVLKHSGASRVSVALSADDRCFSITIEDNGRGFPASCLPPDSNPSAVVSPLGRNGLTNIQRRIEAISARLRIENVVPAGARVSLTLPFVD